MLVNKLTYWELPEKMKAQVSLTPPRLFNGFQGENIIQISNITIHFLYIVSMSDMKVVHYNIQMTMHT